MTSKATVLRLLTHASLRLQSQDDQAMGDAAAYLSRALMALEELRFPHHDPVADCIQRVLADPKAGA